MKKTLAIVLALVMVLSVMAMVPASAEDTVINGWKVLNNQGTFEAVGKAGIKFTSSGAYASPTSCGSFIASAEPVDLTKDVVINFKEISGLKKQSDADCWISISFLSTQSIFNAGASTGYDGFTFLCRPGGQVQLFDKNFSMKGGSTLSSRTPSGVTFGIDWNDFSIEFTKSGAVWSGFAVDSSATARQFNWDDGNTYLSEALNTFNGNKAYIVIGMSIDPAKGTTPTAVVGLGADPFKAADPTPTPSSSTDPTPATGDFTAVYALVAVIACGVVVGSTVVLKKKED